jgi:magnesium-transporting ATPase (P-type)
MSQRPTPNQRTLNLIVGAGLAIQVISFAIIYLMWKHHQPFYYVLPLSVIGMLVTVVPVIFFHKSDPK